MARSIVRRPATIQPVRTFHTFFISRAHLSKLRRLSCVFIALSFLALTRTSFAQASVYGSAMVTDFGFTGTNYPNGTSIKPDTGGIIGGAFYTFPSPSRFKAGIDGRITYSPGYNGGSAYTGALRVSFIPNHNRLRPYFQIGGGVASTQIHYTICAFTCGTTTNRLTNGVVQIVFGLDVRATHHVDIRAFDYGADAAPGKAPAQAGAGFFDTGVVYHF